jgi:hypothetical protein
MHFCMNLNIPWEWYRTFLAVMKEGSLSGAARMLAITQPTAGRHIAALESALGLVLFTRSQTGLQPTDAAVALQGHAQAMENTASMIERSAASFSAHPPGYMAWFAYRRVKSSALRCCHLCLHELKKIIRSLPWNW